MVFLELTNKGSDQIATKNKKQINIYTAHSVYSQQGMTMNAIALIPIKSESKRVVKKNFRILGGKPLYTYIMKHAIEAKCFGAIYVDTDSEEIKEYAKSLNLEVINREERFTKDDINGNDLLTYELEMIENTLPENALIFQLFATAPFLKAETIRESVIELDKNIVGQDSIFTATEENGWFWFGSQPVNYRPDILPRSQDSEHVTKETTGLYGITKKAFEKYKCRIGAKPIIKKITKYEAVDLDDQLDFDFAEYIIAKGLVEC